jgi:hypothetical protein
MRSRRALVIPLAVAALTAGLAVPMAGPAAAGTTSSPPTTAGTAATAALSAARLQETATGTARTVPVDGGYLVVHSFGEISMVNAAGRTAWTDSTQNLYDDWQLTWQDPSFTETPQLAWGSNPVDPLAFTGPGTTLVNDVNPVAVGDLDGTTDVAVAETVGTNMTGQSFCLNCGWPFDVPGSSVHKGTFVSVFDASTGKMIYHELEPDYVTQLSITDDRLIIGDEDGNPQNPGSVGVWGSVSAVRALTVTGTGAATQDWAYSTGAPWARLLDLSATSAGVALAWSDTPSGLGSPGPADGHVLMLDAASGAIRWRVNTTGYPVLTAADDQRGELAVVQETDPALSIGYRLTGLRYSDGATVVSDPSTGALPFSLAVGGRADGDDWAVGAVDTAIDGGAYPTSGGRVTLANPATGRNLWSRTLAASSVGSPIPGGLVMSGGQVVAGSWVSSETPTIAQPLQQVNSITALDAATGRQLWSASGDTGDPMSLSAASGGGAVARAVTSNEDVETYGADGSASASTAGGTGDYLSATTASVASAGSTDLVAGNADGDVSALDGKDLAGGVNHVLWSTHLAGPVNDIVGTELDGQPVVVAAATSEVAVLAARTGIVLTVIKTPDTYAYTATVISAGGTPAVVVPGSALTAYSMTTGAPLWRYTAPAGASFSDAAYADGTVAAEYANSSGQGGSSVMAAVGISAATGRLAWSQAADTATILRGALWNGAYAGPGIAGAGSDGVALAWTDTDGDGRIDVRDIATGALDYSDVSPDLGSFTQYTDWPGEGLVAVSQFGSALITPDGAEASFMPNGLSGAIATDKTGDSALLVANAGTTAYGSDVFTNANATDLTSDLTYDTGNLVSGDFAGNGTEQVVAMPANWTAYQIVNAESGESLPPYEVTLQRGLSVLTLSGATSGDGTSSASHGAAATEDSPVVTYPRGGATEGTQSSAGSVANGLVPTGKQGSELPILEPVKSGTAQPAAGPVDARHTVDSAAADTDPPGYSPAQIQQYLGLTGDGKGQTIAIVDAYDDPDIAADAEAFSQQYGLPGVCGAGGASGDCFHLNVEEQSATAGSDGDWALEESMDVEWAHSVAPDATIDVEEAATGDFAALFAGVATATAKHPAAVSMSWGISEEFSEETYYDHFCRVSATVCVVSSGDLGYPGSYPAYNPSALSVGGTTLTLGSGGSVSSELDWSQSGGGQSWVEREPSYQESVEQSGFRDLPDVSYDADPNTGVAVYDSVPYLGQSGWWVVGGTSLGAPSWSAILADADQLRAGAGKAPLTASDDAVQRDVYSLPASALAAVTSGPDNGSCPVGCAPTAGYDTITGLGSPRAGIDAALAKQ